MLSNEKLLSLNCKTDFNNKKKKKKLKSVDMI